MFGNRPPEGVVGIVGSSPLAGIPMGFQLSAVAQSVLTAPVHVLPAAKTAGEKAALITIETAMRIMIDTTGKDSCNADRVCVFDGLLMIVISFLILDIFDAYVHS
jgi:hypothetical protein